jgi:two-component sensor histidine kinase
LFKSLRSGLYDNGGLGMRLIRALVQQTEAKLRIERHERGIEFVLDTSVKDE